MRKYAWIVATTALWSATVANAQGPTPYGNPGAYGYPGYPVPPYGNPNPYPGMMPPNPYGYPPPNMPYGNPASRSMMPNIPYGNPTMQQPPPGFNGGGPNAGPTEPYLVPPEKEQSRAGAAKLPMLPPADAAPSMMAPTYVDAAAYEPMGPPPEPYVLYEGGRSLAEVKQDNTCVWAQANYIHWWVRRDSTPPLVTTGNPNNPTVGTIGNPDTVILLGNGPIGPKEFSGAELYAGMWLDDERLYALEVGGFWLGTASRQYSFSSNAAGSPALAQPVVVGGKEMAFLFAAPGNAANPFSATGSIAVNSVMDMYGAEINWARNAFRCNGWTVDYFAGVRYVYLSDALTQAENFTPTGAGAGLIPFNGTFPPAGSSFAINDSFNITNRFYGGQVGARVNWTCCWGFDLGAVFKLGLGATSHDVVIDGTTTLISPGGARTNAPGGTLAQPTNIGSHTSTDFSVLPEFTATVGYQVTCNIRLTLGYNMLYWNNIMRVGNNIDRQLDPAQVPTLSALVPPGTSVHPYFPAIRTDFWAQGLNVGMELKF